MTDRDKVDAIKYIIDNIIKDRSVMMNDYMTSFLKSIYYVCEM